IEEELAQLVRLGLNNLPMLRRRLVIKQIASIAGVDEQIIWRSIPGGRPASGASIAESKPTLPETDPRHRPVYDALGCLMCIPGLWRELTDSQHELLDPALVESGPAHDVAEAVTGLCAGRNECDIGAVCTRLESADAQALATEWYTRIDHITD